MANGTNSTKGGGVAKTEAPVNNLAPHGEYDGKLIGQLYPNASSYMDGKASWLKDHTDIDPAKAMDTADAIGKFTGAWSGDIRDAQKNNKKGSAAEMGELLEDFIAKSPQWDNSHDLHRGMRLESSVVDGILKGIPQKKSFDINNGGTASWSTKYDVSENFASTYGGKKVPVIFRTKKMKNATSVEHLTSIHGEHEVLSSKMNNFRPLKATKKNIDGTPGWLIEVEQI